MTDPPFKSGDRVRLKTGKSAIQVLEVDYFMCDRPANNPPRIFKPGRIKRGRRVGKCVVPTCLR